MSAAPGVLVSSAAWRIIAVVLLLISADVVLAVFVEIAFFLIVGHASVLLRHTAGAQPFVPLLPVLPPPRPVPVLPEAPSPPFFEHCAGISATTFPSHFDFQFSLKCCVTSRD